jgi:ATP-binding cassette subfamily A (ABC1) protein 3
MEEVFMRVGKEAEDEKEMEANGGAVSVPMENGHGHNNNGKKLYQHLEKNRGMALLMQQLRAMIVKKFLYAIRNKVLLAVQTIIPIAFLIITLVMLKTLPSISSPPELELSLKVKIYTFIYGDFYKFFILEIQ